MSESLAAEIHRRLRQGGASIATAESLTGGLLAVLLTDVPGASETFRGGVVAYATAVKAQVLGVPAALLAERGAVDPDVATAMAGGVRDRLATTYGVATTGVAGPDPQDGKPVGTVYTALAGPQGSRAVGHRFAGDRARIRHEAALAALRMVAEELARP